MRLEVHHINVSQGDSTLIINRDYDELRKKVLAFNPAPGLTDTSQILHYAVANGIDLEGTVKYAALIDAAEVSFGNDVFQYMQSYGVKGATTQKNFCLIASHYHSDHIGGFHDIFYKQGPNYNNDKTDIVVNYPPGKGYDSGTNNLDPDTNVFASYLSDTEETVKYDVDFTILKPGDYVELGTGVNDGASDVKMRLFCVASDRSVYSVGQLPVAFKGDQNARSLVFVLEYGPFRYFIGGDIGGSGEEAGGNSGIYKAVKKKKPGSSHDDIETSVRVGLEKAYPKSGKTPAGHVCAFKANHHGSASSNDIYLLATTRPKVFLISSGTWESFYHHPTQEVINRIDAGKCANWKNASKVTVPNSIENYYITEIATDNVKPGFVRTFSPGKGKVIGDIIVRPNDDDIKDKGKNGVRLNVFGSGIQTGSPMTLRAAVKSTPLVNPLNAANGPWEHKCTLH
jgi:hypothetical protein